MPIKYATFPNGLNTVKNAISLAKTELAVGENIDLDNEGLLSRRGGYSLLLSGNYKWLSDVDNDLCLAVVGGDLVSLNADLAGHTVLRSGVSGYRMSYVKILNRIYYSNQEIIGYVENGINYDLPVPTQNFKTAMPAGKFLEYFNARLYVAVGNELYLSDVLNYGVRDSRAIPKRFPSEITMIKAVKDGLFIAAGKTYFRGVVDPMEMTPGAERTVADYDAVPYMVTRVDGATVMTDNTTVSGKVIFWQSTEGICMGTDGGGFSNLTKHKIKQMPGAEGAAFFRVNDKGTNQVIMTATRED